MPVERSGIVPDPVNPADIPDLAYGQPLVVDAQDRDGLRELLEDALGLIRLVGGVVTIAGQREDVAPGVTVTTSVVWHYNSFVPRTSSGEPAPPPAEDPAEPVPAAVLE